jgi:hypothetical protein
VETFKRTPLPLFNLPQHFVVPLFQRPYVWKEEEQWEPLWKDVQRIAELRIAEPYLNPQHFLGAVVLQSHEPEGQKLTTWNVIDGQQRLTTLQLLTDAAHAIFLESGHTKFASQLEVLTHNPHTFVPEGESLLKLRHLNNDRDAFDEVMTSEPPIDHASLMHADSRIVKAHAFFASAVSQWLGDPGNEQFSIRAENLTHVLLHDLQLVTIELKASENSQEIFETLNARGTPLTAADLVRNFVFQRLEAEGGDTKTAYKEQWPFETKFWTREVSAGRYLVSRSSLFLNQWLIARLGEEVSPQSTFTRFKSYVEHEAGHKIADLLPVIKAQATQYEAWTEAASKPSGDLSTVEMAVYRMQAGGVELLKPLLIWLHEPGRDLSAPSIDRVVSAAESWIVRRQLLRLAGSDLGRIVADLIKANHDASPTDLADRVISQLARLDATSTYWPGDEEVMTALVTEPAYRRYPRARLRMFLEAAENAYRAETGQPQVERMTYPIEHILPQKWKDSWPVESPEAATDRQDHVHRLGNLTLLTKSLNSKVSNGPWETKRSALLEHNTVKLTGRLITATEAGTWDEAGIDKRSRELAQVLLTTWPVPSGHTGEVVDPQTKAQDWVELKHLVQAGLVEPGTVIKATHRDFVGVTAVVAGDGFIELADKRFNSPSGAARAVRKRPTNGWYFWAVQDGRRLRDVRAQFLNRPSKDRPDVAAT